MENYRKGKNEEEPLDRLKIPIPDLPESFLWMQVRGGSKIRNVLEHALSNFSSSKSVVWTGFGPSVGKAITCAEIMKKEYKHQLHQSTSICYRNVDEYWDPLLPELDQLVVKRKLPMIHICLSLDKLNEKELGYQAPGEVIPYKGQNNQSNQRRQNNHGRNYNRNRNNRSLTGLS